MGEKQPEAPQANRQPAQGPPQGVPVSQREPGALYQFDSYGVKQRAVGRVRGVEVDEAARQVRFEEVYYTDELLLPDECEFQKYRIVVRKIGYASKLDKEAPHKGRVLRSVTAELVGYSEQ